MIVETFKIDLFKESIRTKQEMHFLIDRILEFKVCNYKFIIDYHYPVHSINIFFENEEDKNLFY